MINEKRNIESFIQDGMMEYSGYILLNRCIPDIRDSCKPVIRRILFTMLKEKAFKFTKSASISGKVMAIHPHGSCYPAIVGMVQTDNQLTPWLLGKGNFAQHTSRDLQPSADRYSEVKLGEYATDVLKDLNSKSVKWIPNFDGTIMMPEVLPVKFPMILNYCQSGIGVGMASNIPSFNMKEIAEAIELYVNENIKTNLVPDFATKGRIINNKNSINNINNTGLGSVKLLATYTIEGNTILIDSIPYSTTREAIIDKIIDLIKSGKTKDITSVKDLTGLKGMCIEITCKKNSNINNVVKFLFNNTPLSSSFSSNMNVICDGLPKVMGVWSIIEKWIEWRMDCIRKTYKQDILDMESKLHIYEGLTKITDFIDEVINTIKNSNDENMLQNLIDRFDIDNIQAEYISELKLKNINKTYISKTIKDKKELENKINKYVDVANSDSKVKQIIVDEINKVAKKYGKPRQTEIIQESEIGDVKQEDLIEDYNCRIMYTQQGYIKKHLKQSDNHKIKDEDVILGDITTTNKSTIFIFTDKANRYKIPVNDLSTYTPSVLGDYIYNITDMPKDENIIKIVSIENNSKGYMYFCYNTGKIAKIDIKSFISNNKKLQNCYNTDSKLLDCYYSEKDIDIALFSSEGKALIINSNIINSKLSRNSQGVTGIKLTEGLTCVSCIMDMQKDNHISLITEKGKQVEFLLDDVAPTNKPNEERTLFKYIQGRTGNSGNFLINTRGNGDKLTSVNLLK